MYKPALSSLGRVDWPLYRTGRAAFPHPAPCEANASAVVVDTDIYPGVSQRALLQQVIESIPTVALVLASPVQPEEQAPTYLVAEIVQAVKIKRNGIYIKEVSKNGLISHNPSYPPIVDDMEVKVLGKVLGKVAGNYVMFSSNNSAFLQIRYRHFDYSVKFGCE